MGVFRGASVAPCLALLCLWLAAHAAAQVTFSRDWNPGKRDPPACGAAPRPAAAVCHLLLDELRQLVACESRAAVRALQAEEPESNPAPLYSGRR